MPKRKVKETKPARTFRKARYTAARKVCSFCATKGSVIDYKDFDKLRGFISDRAKISPRRRTGTCARHQRAIAIAIKRARHLALLPYVPSHMRKMAGAGSVTGVNMREMASAGAVDAG